MLTTMVDLSPWLAFLFRQMKTAVAATIAMTQAISPVDDPIHFIDAMGFLVVFPPPVVGKGLLSDSLVLTSFWL